MARVTNVLGLTLLCFLPNVLCQMYNTQMQIPGYGCCTPYYQTPGTCCPQPCCVASTPALCCKQEIPEVMKLRFSLKTSIPWDNDYADPTSSKYKALAKKFQDAIKEIYAKTDSFKEARVSRFNKGSTIVVFVVAFKSLDANPVDPLKKAVSLKFIPNEKDAAKIQIDGTTLKLEDKVVPEGSKINLDMKKPAEKQQDDKAITKDLLDNLNAKRKIHLAPALSLDIALSKTATDWAKELGKKKQMKYSPKNAKEQSEIIAIICKKTGENLTGKEIFDKWYSEAKIFFNAKATLKTKSTSAKAFIEAMWKSSKKIGVGIYRYKKGTSPCFIVTTFISPKAAPLTNSKTVNANVLKGSYKPTNKDESYEYIE